MCEYCSNLIWRTRFVLHSTTYSYMSSVSFLFSSLNIYLFKVTSNLCPPRDTSKLSNYYLRFSPRYSHWKILFPPKSVIALFLGPHSPFIIICHVLKNCLDSFHVRRVRVNWMDCLLKQQSSSRRHCWNFKWTNSFQRILKKLLGQLRIDGSFFNCLL